MAPAIAPRSAEPPPSVAWRDGVQLAGSVVWCDAVRARGLCFLSHAGVRTRAAHRQVLGTTRTRALVAALSGGPARGASSEWLVTPFGRPFSLGAARLELFPSGHLPGAASLVLAAERGGRRVIYGGDINPLAPGTPSLAEPCEVRGGDVLVVAAPIAALGRPLPPRAEVLAALVAAIERALDAGRLPVVLAPPLGVAVEALAGLGRAGIGVRAHPRIARVVEAYREIGIVLPAIDWIGPLPPLPAFAPTPTSASAAPASAPGRARRRPDPRPAADRRVLLWPLELRASPALDRLGARRPLRRIALTGLALDPATAARLGVDEALPLADHADLDALAAYVRDTGAREVHLTAGAPARIAAVLGPRGVRVHVLGPPRQLPLFDAATDDPPLPRRPPRQT